MSTRNLEYIFAPRSVAVIGASVRPGSIGHTVLHNLKASGFQGAIFPVNPKHPVIDGLKAFPDVAALTSQVDLAVICTPAPTVPDLVAQLGARGTKGVIVISASGSQDAGLTAQWRRSVLQAAQPHLIRIVGPNCVGVLSPPCGLNASFAHRDAQDGKIAFISQSGAMLTTVLDWAAARGIGFSRLVSLGDMSDVDFGDMLDYLATDPHTKAVFLYVEAITQARKFMSAARACARLKPVIVIKAGRHSAAAKAAQSHTGALAGSDVVYDAAFRRAGVLRVADLGNVFDALETIALTRDLKGERLAIVTNGGGMGVLATDTLLDRNGKLAALSDETIAQLNAILPPHWSHANPVDIVGDADRERYQSALEIILRDPNVDCTLAIHCPVAVASDEDCAQGVIDAAASQKRPILTNWLGVDAPARSRKLLRAAGLATFDTPDEAVEGFMDLVDFQKAQKNLLQAPPSLPKDFHAKPEQAGIVIEAALARQATWLTPPEIAAVLTAYQIPCVRSVLAPTPNDLAAAAEGLSFPVALKIQSPDILHKSDAGGVVLDLPDIASTVKAARNMQEKIAKALPQARIEGFLLQEMADLPHAQELILGMTVDATFGPIMLVGHGGTAVEVINDKAIGLPPLNLHLANEMLSRTKIFRQLQGYRDHPRVDLNAVQLTLVKLSQLIVDQPAIAEIDINPLLVNEAGVLCVDARIRVVQPGQDSLGRLAICPYPDQFEQRGTLPAIGEYYLRPVRPDDAEKFQSFGDSITSEDIRFRFMSVKRPILPEELSRLTQIDYDREMALLMLEASTDRIAGIARLVSDSEGREAEFAIIVRSDLKRKGVGTRLMQALLGYAKEKGLRRIFGEVLRENSAMLALSKKVGFSAVSEKTAGQQVHVVLDLTD